MSNKLHLFGAALCAGLLNQSAAQLVFVPDLNFRTALNNRVPGVVDANGYIDTQSFAVQTASVIGTAEGVAPLVIDWTPADLTGLEGLIALYSFALAGEPGLTPVVTLPILPTSLHHVHLREMSIAMLPAWPATMETFVMIDMDGMASLPALPAALAALYLEGCDQLTGLPSLPSGMGELQLIELPLLTDIPNWPVNSTEIELDGLSALTQVPQFLPTDYAVLIRFANMPLTELPDWPEGLEELTLLDLPNVTMIPTLPATVVRLELDCENVLCLPSLPSGLLELHFVWIVSYCMPNLPPNMALFMDGFLLAVDSSALCTLINSSCPPGSPSATGRVFLDGNSNGLYDPGEQPYSQVGIAAGGAVTGVAADGTYGFGLALGLHTLSCIPNSGYIGGIAPATHVATFTDVADVDSLNDFAVTLQPNIQDLIVNATGLTPPVPGFINGTRVSYLNAGTQVTNGSITFTHDAALTFVSSVPTPDVINGNAITWNFTQLQIGEQRSIDITLNTPVATGLGTSISHTATADPLITDQTPLDNVYTVTDIVVGSFDPNDKTVEPTELTPAEVGAGERVAYTVRFQNTGTYQATRVIITDTLSSDLQWNTMQLVAASHAHTWHIENGVLFVVFDNINLPDSNANEPASHGFVKFSMMPVSTLMLGATVSNTANIYFDFNEPVITNAAVFAIDDNTPTLEVEPLGMHLSPNPVSDALTVLFTQPADEALLEVVDVTGRVVFATVANGTRAVLDVQALKAGSYQVRVDDRLPGRFVKR